MQEKVIIPLEPTPHPFIRPQHSCSKAPSRRQQSFPAVPDTGTSVPRQTLPRMQPSSKRSALWKAARQAWLSLQAWPQRLRLFLSLLKSGDHLLSTNIIYGGTFGLISSLLTKFGIEVSFVDTTDLELVKASMRENTRMLFLETPANPTMAVSDIGELSKIAKEAEAITVVDNTFATPYFQRPLGLGADIVVESCTKYIGGHGDLLGGVAVGSEELIQSMKRPSLLAGGTMGTHEAWLCLRGLKTLHLRMERHAENAMRLAQVLRVPSQGGKGQLSRPCQPSSSTKSPGGR